jgi:hypothetical protein
MFSKRRNLLGSKSAQRVSNNAQPDDVVKRLNTEANKDDRYQDMPRELQKNSSSTTVGSRKTFYLAKHFTSNNLIEAILDDENNETPSKVPSLVMTIVDTSTSPIRNNIEKVKSNSKFLERQRLRQHQTINESVTS